MYRPSYRKRKALTSVPSLEGGRRGCLPNKSPAIRGVALMGHRELGEGLAVQIIPTIDLSSGEQKDPGVGANRDGALPSQ